MHITRAIIQRNDDILFVFGDNDLRRGFGGMAYAFRGELNTVGISTKKRPSNDDNAFYTDTEFENNRIKILEDIAEIKGISSRYKSIYIPEGIGTGLSQLDTRAPKTYKFLQEQLSKFKTIPKGLLML